MKIEKQERKAAKTLVTEVNGALELRSDAESGAGDSQGKISTVSTPLQIEEKDVTKGGKRVPYLRSNSYKHFEFECFNSS